MTALDMEAKIHEFLETIKLITDSDIVGFDFIAVGDDYYFHDYLLHPDMEVYLEKLEEYFSDNPSLLLVEGLDEEIATIESLCSAPVGVRQPLILTEKKILKATFTRPSDFTKPSSYYWKAWCDIIKSIYPTCRSIYFKKINFKDFGVDQTTALFIYFDKDINKSGLHGEKFRQYLTKTANAFLYEEAVHVLFPRQISEIHRQASRAAISQVMARNMSHNIGSHVLSKFKDRADVRNVGKTAGQYDGSAYSSLYKRSTPNELEPEEQIAYFNEYLKNRMDFLADIATSDPVMENVMMFKQEIIKGIDRNRILLNRISGVSDNDLKFKIVLKKGGVKLGKKDDPPVSITNDVLGAQAFYILIENIIRNVVKHGKARPQEKGNIEITIDVADCAQCPSFYEVSIYDNLKRSAHTIVRIVNSRNRAFDLTILNDKGELRPYNLGTIEMDVCAAYLRCLPITSIENEDKYQVLDEGTDELVPNNTDEPILLHAYKHTHDSDRDEHSLGYKLYLNRPKEILVIDDEGSFALGGLSKAELIGKGIWVIGSVDIDGSRIFNHQLLYTHASSEDAYLVSFHSTLPKRVVKKCEGISLDSAEDFMSTVWEQYVIAEYLKENDAVRIVNGNIDKLITSNAGKLVTSSNPESSAKTIFIDNHNNNWCSVCKLNVDHNCGCRAGEYEGPDYFYYDMACGHSKIQKYLDKVTSEYPDGNDSLIKAQYLEVVFTKILVVDERIQENVVINKKKYHASGFETDFYQYFKKQNLVIPTVEEANLNSTSFGKLGEEGSEALKIESFLAKHMKDAQFCVLHLGILEKMMDSGSHKDVEGTESVIARLFPGEARKKLVITSGRGKPNNLPLDLSFVPLALIQNAIETVFDKFVLTKILFNSRKAK